MNDRRMLLLNPLQMIVAKSQPMLPDSATQTIPTILPNYQQAYFLSTLPVQKGGNIIASSVLLRLVLCEEDIVPPEIA